MLDDLSSTRLSSPHITLTGLVSDRRMCDHVCSSRKLVHIADDIDSGSENSDSDDHPECPERIIRIMDYLEELGFKSRCTEVQAREVANKSFFFKSFILFKFFYFRLVRMKFVECTTQLGMINLGL